MKEEQIELIDVASIRVANPRVRDPKRFKEIVANIQEIGLKRPITVTRRHGPGEHTYDLVCGQGRLEAFIALEQKFIPAIVRAYDESQALLASLAENIARRRMRAIEQIRAIKWMAENGQSADEISRKTGLGPSYTKGILRLLETGEERLLDAALHGRIPITIAVKIADGSDEETQSILMKAYEQKEITQKTLNSFRHVVNQRRFLGRGVNSTRPGPRNSADEFIASYRTQANRQKLIIKKARACEARLLSITAAFRVLLADEHFTTLLRAEKIGTLPKFLAARLANTDL